MKEKSHLKTERNYKITVPKLQNGLKNIEMPPLKILKNKDINQKEFINLFQPKSSEKLENYNE